MGHGGIDIKFVTVCHKLWLLTVRMDVIIMTKIEG